METCVSHEPQRLEIYRKIDQFSKANHGSESSSGLIKINMTQNYRVQDS